VTHKICKSGNNIDNNIWYYNTNGNNFCTVTYNIILTQKTIV